MDTATFLRSEADRMDFFEAPYEAAMFRGAADEVDRLRAALEPFAAEVKRWAQNHLSGHVKDTDEVYINCGVIRRAADAIKTSK